jgi:hypothetical protein
MEIVACNMEHNIVKKSGEEWERGRNNGKLDTKSDQGLLSSRKPVVSSLVIRPICKSTTTCYLPLRPFFL